MGHSGAVMVFIEQTDGWAFYSEGFCSNSRDEVVTISFFRFLNKRKVGFLRCGGRPPTLVLKKRHVLYVLTRGCNGRHSCLGVSIRLGPSRTGS